MRRIPDRPARRIDRLAGRAHCFHRYAHHPLCQAYAGEVLRFGRVRLCRGCSFVAIGALAGLLSGGILPVLPFGVLVLFSLLLLAWGAAILGGSWFRRVGKEGTRLLPALGVAFLLLQGIRRGTALGWALVATVGLGVGMVVRIYRRRGPWRGPCASCPERDHRPCSGFLPQFRREKAFGRWAGRRLAGVGAFVDQKIPPVD